jgi:hypothetical protein
MKKIINCSTISEGTFSPRLIIIFYDSDYNKIFRKSDKISSHQMEKLVTGLIKIEDIVNEKMEFEEQLTDDEVIKMYNEAVNYPLQYKQERLKEFKILENYVKSLNRDEKLNDLGI